MPDKGLTEEELADQIDGELEEEDQEELEEEETEKKTKAPKKKTKAESKKGGKKASEKVAEKAKAVKGGVAKEKKVSRPYASLDTETLVRRKTTLEDQYNTSSARLVLTKSKIAKYDMELEFRKDEGEQ